MARKRQTDPFTTDPLDPVELIGRMLVGSSYRVPVEGKGSKKGMQPCDIAGAVGYMKSRLGRELAIAVATRADEEELLSVAMRALYRIRRVVGDQRPPPLRLNRPDDRFRLRLIAYHATFELVHPQERRPYGLLAREAKMRKDTYIQAHRCATAVLQEALNEARTEFGHRLWAGGH